jgi:hypothetical protein
MDSNGLRWIGKCGICGRAANKQDFEKIDALYPANVDRTLLKKKARSKETALVPVVFKANGVLMTAKEYNDPKHAENSSDAYFTTLDAYQKLTGEAMDERKMDVLPGLDSKPVFIYDALGRP